MGALIRAPRLCVIAGLGIGLGSLSCAEGSSSTASGTAPPAAAGAASEATAAGSGTGTGQAGARQTVAKHVLLVIADDLGVDELQAYADLNGVADGQRAYPATPNIDAICKSGVRFTEAWAMPTCTPTRGSILTGRYGFRTGLDGVGKKKQIRSDEQTLPRVLGKAGIKTANLGKWHLGHDDAIGGLRTPNEMGWDHYAGAIDNLDGYFSYAKVVDGREVSVDNYATTETVDDALAWATSQDPQSPWLMWVAFNAPHVPFHVPPASLHAHGDARDEASQYDAMVEALDTELGRLRAGLPKDTIVVFLGDNGSPAKAVRAPLDRKRAKGTLYQGGVHVPLCAVGEGLAGARSEQGLVSSVDLYATLAELMGVEALPAGAGTDSKSFVSVLRGQEASAREFVYAEQNRQHERKAKHAGGRAIRDARYKLLMFEDGREALYDLQADPRENTDLAGSDAAGHLSAKSKLRTALDAL